MCYLAMEEGLVDDTLVQEVQAMAEVLVDDTLVQAKVQAKVRAKVQADTREEALALERYAILKVKSKTRFS